jgi:hypothetical protein
MDSVHAQELRLEEYIRDQRCPNISTIIHISIHNHKHLATITSI